MLLLECLNKKLMVLGVFKQEAYGTWSVETTCIRCLECLSKKHMVLGVFKQEAYGTWSV